MNHLVPQSKRVGLRSDYIYPEHTHTHTHTHTPPPPPPPPPLQNNIRNKTKIVRKTGLFFILYIDILQEVKQLPHRTMTTSYNKHATYDVITHKRAAGVEKKNKNCDFHVLILIQY